MNQIVKELAEKGMNAIDSMKQKRQQSNAEIVNALRNLNKVRPVNIEESALKII